MADEKKMKKEDGPGNGANANGQAQPRHTEQPIEQEMEHSYIDYAMSVIMGRAIPDVRDGLKPVHRRILFAMNDQGQTHDKPYRKSARIVGEVLGKYHPHGDIAVYDTLVRMAQSFSLRYPLIDGQGNFGSVDGDSAAAMRYTECRLSKISKEMLEDIEKDTVGFTKNFDETLDEPLVLPARLPNLLINGSSGIAVGMATNIPPHNIVEVIDGIIRVIDEPGVDLIDLMDIIKGPDFPTGGIIYGKAGIQSAYYSGRGALKVRAKTHIEDRDKGGERKRIIVDEIPYMVNKSTLIEGIADLVKRKVIDGITDLRDESDRDGMRVVIELRKGVFDDVILNQLFHHTSLETTFGIINYALVDGEPRVLGLRELIDQFVNFRREVVRRRTQWELTKAEDREHILKGLIIALENLDAVIETIRKSRDGDEAKDKLMARFGLSEKQVKAILDMRLQRLTGMERDKVRQEEREVAARIVRLREILADEKEILKIIRDDLRELKELYGDERRTVIVEGEMDMDLEDIIPNERVVVQITNRGYVKRQPVDAFRKQRRGGVGLVGMETKEEDYVVDMYTTLTHNFILFFTNKGRLHWLKCYRIPIGGRHAQGKPIVNLIPRLEEGETINAMIPVDKFDDDRYIVFATRKGLIKKTRLSAYKHIRVSGINAIGLYPDDDVVATVLSDGKKELVLVSKTGQAVRFDEARVRPTGRSSHGVRGIRLRDKDELVTMTAPMSSSVILILTENGFGKRSQVSDYRKTNRGAHGVIGIKSGERNGNVVDVRVVEESDEMMLTSTSGMTIRIPVRDISIIGRATMGVRVMRLRTGDKLIAVAKLAKADVEEDAGEEAVSKKALRDIDALVKDIISEQEGGGKEGNGTSQPSPAPDEGDEKVDAQAEAPATKRGRGGSKKP